MRGAGGYTYYHIWQALCELLELYEKKAFKKPTDFELMDQVLRCLRSLMNLEFGMNHMLGCEPEDDAEAGAPVDADGAAVAAARALFEKPAQDESGAPLPPRQSQVDAAAAAAEPRKRASLGLRQLALCVDSKHESVEAKRVQCTALTLLSAAALFSAEGHAQVLRELGVPAVASRY